MQSNYDILGLRDNASLEEIKSAFRALAKVYHPDRNPGDRVAETKFKEITSAYMALTKSNGNSNSGTVDNSIADYEWTGTWYQSYHGATVSHERKFYRLGAGFDNGIYSISKTMRLTVSVKPHLLLTRKGNDIHYSVSIKRSAAKKGHKITIPSPDGETKITKKLPFDITKDKTLYLEGDGFPDYNTGKRGNYHIHIALYGESSYVQEALGSVARGLEALVDLFC